MTNLRKSSIPNTIVSGDYARITAGIISWLNDPDATKHCTVTGGPGAGKSWMVKELVTTYEKYNKLGIGLKSVVFR